MQTHQLQPVSRPARQPYNKEDHMVLAALGQDEMFDRNGDTRSTEGSTFRPLHRRMHVNAVADMNQRTDERTGHKPALAAKRDIQNTVEAASYRQLLHQMQASVAVDRDVGQNVEQRLPHSTPAPVINPKDDPEPAEAAVFRELLHQMQLQQLPSTTADQAAQQPADPSRLREVEEETRNVAELVYVNAMEVEF